MKIVNIAKFIRSIITILIIIGVLLLILMNSSLSYKEIAYKTIYVYSGDTLWSIAKEVQTDNNYYKGKDVRYIIDDLVKINNLESKTLFVNQELQVPVL